MAGSSGRITGLPGEGRRIEHRRGVRRQSPSRARWSWRRRRRSPSSARRAARRPAGKTRVVPVRPQVPPRPTSTRARWTWRGSRSGPGPARAGWGCRRDRGAPVVGGQDLLGRLPGQGATPGAVLAHAHAVSVALPIERDAGPERGDRSSARPASARGSGVGDGEAVGVGTGVGVGSGAGEAVGVGSGDDVGPGDGDGSGVGVGRRRRHPLGQGYAGTVPGARSAAAHGHDAHGEDRGREEGRRPASGRGRSRRADRWARLAMAMLPSLGLPIRTGHGPRGPPRDRTGVPACHARGTVRSHVADLPRPRRRRQRATRWRPGSTGCAARGHEAHALTLPRREAEDAVAAFEAQVPDEPGVVVGGHSFGGRVASLSAAGIGRDPGDAAAALRGARLPLVPAPPPRARRTRPRRGRRTGRRSPCRRCCSRGPRTRSRGSTSSRRSMPTLARGRLETWPRLGHGLLPVREAVLDRIVAFLRRGRGGHRLTPPARPCRRRPTRVLTLTEYPRPLPQPGRCPSRRPAAGGHPCPPPSDRRVPRSPSPAPRSSRSSSGPSGRSWSRPAAPAGSVARAAGAVDASRPPRRARRVPGGAASRRIRRPLHRPQRRSTGAYGAYQIMPSNWPAWAGRYLGDRHAKPTPANQDKVAAGRVTDLRRAWARWDRVAYWWLTGTAVPHRAGPAIAAITTWFRVDERRTGRGLAGATHGPSGSSTTGTPPSHYAGAWADAGHHAVRLATMRTTPTSAGATPPCASRADLSASSARSGPTRGRMTVSSTGGPAVTVDLRARVLQPARAIYPARGARASGPTRSSSASSGRRATVVALDRFLIGAAVRRTGTRPRTG